MKLKTIRRSLIVRAIACAICFYYWWSFRQMFGDVISESPEWWGLCAIASITFAVTSHERRARLAWGMAIVSCLVMTGWKAAYFYPLEQRVKAMSFVDAPLPEVLKSISSQRRVKPYRRFIIDDSASLERRLTVTIPAGSTFGNTLAQIADAARCDYDWHWYSWCGNTYPPSTTRVTVFARGTTPQRNHIWELDRSRLWRRDENGVLITNPDGAPIVSSNNTASLTK